MTSEKLIQILRELKIEFAVVRRDGPIVGINFLVDIEEAEK
jgi:hypothetical protein